MKKMFVRTKEFGKENQRKYFYLEKRVRVPNQNKVRSIHIDYLGPVEKAEKGKCPKCGKIETIYPKYNCCESCLEKIPELKAIAERKTRKVKRGY